jgi:hypothetical protein
MDIVAYLMAYCMDIKDKPRQCHLVAKELS